MWIRRYALEKASTSWQNSAAKELKSGKCNLKILFWIVKFIYFNFINRTLRAMGGSMEFRDALDLRLGNQILLNQKILLLN